MKPLLISLILLLSTVVVAQNGDCNTALSVCDDFFDVNDSPVGTGVVWEVAPGSCQTSGEFNSAWYVFTVQEDGLFSFTLVPDNLNDDYDWSLFNITDNGCEGINSGMSPEVSCNSYGVLGGVQGPTGISTENGGSGNSNGPGDLAGPPFNADVPVQAGQTFALVVMNWSATLNGYELDFTTSEVSIFDNQPPVIEAVTFDCDQDEFVVELSEACQPDNMVSANVSFLLNGESFSVTDVESASANTTTFSVSVDGLQGLSGEVVIEFQNAITDICGNPLALSYSFFLPGSPELLLTAEPACDGTGGEVQAVATGANGECFEFTLNGNDPDFSSCATATFENLVPGNYTVQASGDISDCPSSVTIAVTDIPLDVDAGADTVLCDLGMDLQATFNGGNFEWVDVPGIFFSTSSSATSAVNALEAGVYTLMATVSSGDCTISDGVNVTFNNPPALDVIITGESCADACDGAVSISNEPGEITVWLEEQSLSGTQVVFSDLCPGIYAVDVMISPECTVDSEVVIDGPDPVQAGFVADPWVTSIDQGIVELISTSTGADSVGWFVFFDDHLNASSDTLLLQMPEQPGSYPVLITAYGENGCTDDFLAYIFVQDNFQVFVPNSFTPDFDGINDFFAPQFSYPPVMYELTIFDRWGEVIFRTTDPNQVWTGQVHGGEHFAANGIYAWIMKAQGLDIEATEHAGHVLLIR